MKKYFALILAGALFFSLASCGNNHGNNVPSSDNASGSSQQVSEPVELIVFAAASMTETLTELGERYEQEHQDVRIVFNFDSSGTLKTQIQEGAEVDVFISAGQKQMDQLDISADPQVNTERLDFVLADSRFNILENKVALAVPEGNPAGIHSYEELAQKLNEGSALLAMGNADVPVGQYTQKIFDYIWLQCERSDHSSF